MDSRIVAQIIAYGNQNQEEESEKLLKALLEKDPKNIELWLRLAMLYNNSPYNDYTLAAPCLEKAFELDPDNVQAILLYAYFSLWEYQAFSEAFFNRLNTFPAQSNEVKSMIKYVMSWHYGYWEKKVDQRRKQLLEESVNLYQGHVYNNMELAVIYEKEDRFAEAAILEERAKKNVIKGPHNLETRDFTNPDEFINERIKGLYSIVR